MCLVSLIIRYSNGTDEKVGLGEMHSTQYKHSASAKVSTKRTFLTLDLENFRASNLCHDKILEIIDCDDVIKCQSVEKSASKNNQLVWNRYIK